MTTRAIYRRTSVGLWNDRKFRALSRARPNAQTLWIYLLTGSFTTSVPGLVSASKAALAEALHWRARDITDKFGEIEKSGMGTADWEAPLIWLPHGLRHNWPTSPSNVTGFVRVLDTFPECELKNQAILHMYRELSPHKTKMGESYASPLMERFPEICRQYDTPELTPGYPSGLPSGHTKGLTPGYPSGLPSETETETETESSSSRGHVHLERRTVLTETNTKQVEVSERMMMTDDDDFCLRHLQEMVTEAKLASRLTDRQRADFKAIPMTNRTRGHFQEGLRRMRQQGGARNNPVGYLLTTVGGMSADLAAERRRSPAVGQPKQAATPIDIETARRRWEAIIPEEYHAKMNIRWLQDREVTPEEVLAGIEAAEHEEWCYVEFAIAEARRNAPGRASFPDAIADGTNAAGVIFHDRDGPAQSLARESR